MNNGYCKPNLSLKLEPTTRSLSECPIEDGLHHTLSVEVIMVVQGIPSLGEPQVGQGGHQQQVRPKDERKLDTFPFILYS